MPNTIPYVEPQLVGNGQIPAPLIAYYAPLQGAAFRRGDFLTFQTGGTVVTPPGPGAGTLTGVAGPVPAVVTIATVASAGAPAATYYVELTYTAGAGNESVIGNEFAVNAPAGQVPTITVSAVGAPAGATAYNVYASIYPGFEVLQGSAATGATFTFGQALANYTGVNRAASGTGNSIVVANGIVGIAVVDSDAVFYTGPGGSSRVNNQSLFGATMSQPPLQALQAPLAQVLKLSGGTLLEVNLRQTVGWNDSLVGLQVGLYLDPVSQTFVADPSLATKVAYIFQASNGVPATQGVSGDLGKRVVLSFLPAALA